MVYLLQEWSEGLERLTRLKYYNVQKRQIITLGLNTAKNTAYMEKRFK